MPTRVSSTIFYLLLLVGLTSSTTYQIVCDARCALPPFPLPAPAGDCHHNDSGENSPVDPKHSCPTSHASQTVIFQANGQDGRVVFHSPTVSLETLAKSVQMESFEVVLLGSFGGQPSRAGSLLTIHNLRI
jgi:hypothetical protein